jgi:signal transduction histidine kinase
VTSCYREVFAYGPEIVIAAMDGASVVEELERRRPPGVEVVGARSARLFGALAGLHGGEAQRLEKAETIRRMTGGVYHSLSNIFTTLHARASLLLGAVRSNRGTLAQIAQGLEVVVSNLSRGSEILRRLRAVVRDVEGEPAGQVDVREIAREVLTLAEPFIREAETKGKPIALRQEFDEVPLVVGHSSELVEVLLNLIVNAIEAMPQGGVLALETRADGTGLVLRVHDTGTGIPDVVKAKLFEPFFTTKPGGTGLGLSVSREIVRRHGGDLTVDSTRGQGTCVTIRLPAADRCLGKSA